MFSLKLFGGLSLERGGIAVTGPATQRHRLAVLALLAVSRRHTLTRDKLMASLWPESDAEHARGLLNQAVHVLRRTVGSEAILSSGEDVQLNTALVSCDVIGFEAALHAGDLRRAAELYTGPFLDGFFLGDSPEFEAWVGGERDRLAAAYARALQGLAESAETAGDRAGAVQWWKARAALDPYDSGITVRLVLALEASGNRAAALHEAAAHQRLLRDELDLAPAKELVELEQRLRSAPAPIPFPERRESAELPKPAASASQPPIAVRRSLPVLRYAAVTIVAAALLFGAVRLSSRPSRSPSATGTVAPSVDEIARAVARELERRQLGDTGLRQAAERTRSIPAYELYLRGSDPAVLRSDSAARRGLDYFRRAVALDSSYAAAWAGLARLTLRTTAAGDAASRRQALASAELAARRALVLDDSLAEAHATLGLVRASRNEPAEAESELRRATELEPHTARNYEYLVRLYVWLGRPEEALAAARRARELDPLSPSATAELARAMLANGQCDQALAELQKIADLDPPLQRAAPLAAQCQSRKERWQEALATLRPQAESPQAIGLYGYLLAGAGRREEARTMLDTLIARDRIHRGQALNIALVSAGLDSVDRALTWLKRAIDDEIPIAFSEAALIVTGILDSRPRDPRVIALRRRLGLQNR